MLTDLSIDAAQKILRNQFTKSGGLQDTVLGQKLMFKEVSRPFLQILHNGRKHWLLVSNYNCQPGEINLYDSLYHGRVTDQVKAQICTIYKCPTDKLVINAKPCQQQTNGVDCGIYTVAFAYFVLSGQAFNTIDETKLRNHFLRCLESGIFQPFPFYSKSIMTNKEETKEVEVHCRCRMPWLWRDKNIQMAECEICAKWFHKKCENIPSDVFIHKSLYWYCSNCMTQNS